MIKCGPLVIGRLAPGVQEVNIFLSSREGDQADEAT
jgi:hypothetical protein